MVFRLPGIIMEGLQGAGGLVCHDETFENGGQTLDEPHTLMESVHRAHLVYVTAKPHTCLF